MPGLLQPRGSTPTWLGRSSIHLIAKHCCLFFFACLLAFDFNYSILQPLSESRPTFPTKLGSATRNLLAFLLHHLEPFWAGSCAYPASFAVFVTSSEFLMLRQKLFPFSLDFLQLLLSCLLLLVSESRRDVRELLNFPQLPLQGFPLLIQLILKVYLAFRSPSCILLPCHLLSLPVRPAPLDSSCLLAACGAAQLGPATS